MPTRNRSADARAILKNRPAVAVHLDDPDCPWCPCQISLVFDPNAAQACFTLRMFLCFENVPGNQLVALRLPLRSLDGSKGPTIAFGHSTAIPADIQSHLSKDAPAHATQQYLTLQLHLDSPATVSVPPGLDVSLLTPTAEFHNEAKALYRVCSATRLAIHTRGHGVDESRLKSLQSLVDLANGGNLTPLEPDGRAFGGLGAQTASRDIFRIGGSPPAYQTVGKKRRRPGGKSSEQNPQTGLGILSIDTDSPSPPPRAVSEGPAPPAYVHPPLSPPVAPDVVSRQMLQETLEKMVPEIVQRKLKQLLSAQNESLYEVISDVVDAEAPWDSVMDGYKQEFRDEVDDAMTEVRCVRDECITEVDQLYHDTVEKVHELQRSALDELNDWEPPEARAAEYQYAQPRSPPPWRPFVSSSSSSPAADNFVRFCRHRRAQAAPMLPTTTAASVPHQAPPSPAPAAAALWLDLRRAANPNTATCSPTEVATETGTELSITDSVASGRPEPDARGSSRASRDGGDVRGFILRASDSSNV
ncbi:hypothetical protein IWX49DRAFT_583918 [Phyllosticta citricarpa]|uniref:Uncharacterized protein n=1 Tax=Phyllosticta citricarpa TaxID=55181 RepID=A0ABR1L9F1_9PEZI